MKQPDVAPKSVNESHGITIIIETRLTLHQLELFSIVDQPSLRSELVRIGKDIWIAMNRIALQVAHQLYERVAAAAAAVTLTLACPRLCPQG
jgi:hypothetical protein